MRVRGLVQAGRRPLHGGVECGTWRVAVRRSAIADRGLFASEPIARGEVVAVFTGRLIYSESVPRGSRRRAAPAGAWLAAGDAGQRWIEVVAGEADPAGFANEPAEGAAANACFSHAVTTLEQAWCA